MQEVRPFIMAFPLITRMAGQLHRTLRQAHQHLCFFGSLPTIDAEYVARRPYYHGDTIKQDRLLPVYTWLFLDTMLSDSRTQNEAQSVAPATQRFTAGGYADIAAQDIRVSAAAGTQLRGWRCDGVAGPRYVIRLINIVVYAENFDQTGATRLFCLGELNLC
jgi:hypothetical protein